MHLQSLLCAVTGVSSLKQTTKANVCVCVCAHAEGGFQGRPDVLRLSELILLSRVYVRIVEEYGDVKAAPSHLMHHRPGARRTAGMQKYLQ